MDEDLEKSVQDLRKEFAARDKARRGTVPRSEFTCVLLRNGGLLPQVQVLTNQFLIEGTNSVDYVAFMKHMQELVPVAAASPPGQFSKKPAAPETSQKKTTELQPTVLLLPKSGISISRTSSVHATATSSASGAADFIDRAVRTAASAARVSPFRSRTLGNIATSACSVECSRSDTVPVSGAPCCSVPKEDEADRTFPDETVREVCVDEVSYLTAQREPPSHQPLAEPAPEATLPRVHLKEVFEIIDSDGDDRLAPHDLLTAFFSRGFTTISQEELLALFDGVDEHRLGYIDYSAFCTLVSRLPVPVLQQLRNPAKWRCKPNTTVVKSVPHYLQPTVNSSRKGARSADPPISKAVTKPLPARKPVARGWPRPASARERKSSVMPSVEVAGRSISRTPRSKQRADFSRKASPHPGTPIEQVKLRPTEKKPTSAPSDADRKSTSPFQLEDPHPIELRMRPQGFTDRSRSTLVSPEEENINTGVHTSAVEPPSSRFEEAARKVSGRCSQLLSICSKVDKTRSGKIQEAILLKFLSGLIPDLSSAESKTIVTRYSDDSMVDYLALVGDLIVLDEAPAIEKVKDQVPRKEPKGPSLNALEEKQVNANFRPSAVEQKADKNAELALARERMLRLLQHEWMQVLITFGHDASAQVMGQFLLHDCEEAGYLSREPLCDAIESIFADARRPLPSWFIQRCLKIAHQPFEEDMIGGEFATLEQKAKKDAAAFALRDNKAVRVYDYRFLLEVLCGC